MELAEDKQKFHLMAENHKASGAEVWSWVSFMLSKTSDHTKISWGPHSLQ